MNDLQPSGSGSISHNAYALNSFAPSHRRIDSNQTLIPSPSVASYTPPPIAILNSLSPVWETKAPLPKKSRRQSMIAWKSSNESLPTNPIQDDSILGSLKRVASPFRRAEPLEAKPSVYRPPSISTPTSLRSRSNSSSSSQPPVTPGEAIPPKPYHYTKRAQTYPMIPETPNVSYTRPPDVSKEMTTATKRHSQLIRVKQIGDPPDRDTSKSDPDLGQHQQREDVTTAARTRNIIRDSERQSHSKANHETQHETPDKELRAKGAEISLSPPPIIVPSRRKESLPQAIFTSSKDDFNLNKNVHKPDPIFSKSWGRQKHLAGNKRDSRRASSIFQPHLIPNPNFYPDREGIIAEDDEDPPGTPGIRRKDERNGWSGEWNQDTIQEVIDKLRALH